MRHDLPARQGLYDPAFEHDACGVTFVVHMKGLRSHDIVQQGIGALCNLAAPRRVGQRGQHRRRRRHPASRSPTASCGRSWASPLPARGRLRHRHRLPARRPRPRPTRRSTRVEKIAASEGLRVLGWRDVPVDDSMIGSTARGGRAVVPPGVPGRRRAGATTRSSAGSTSCASGSSTRSAAPEARAASTSRACRAARSSTRACSPPRSWPSSSPTCATSASSRRWPWCTRRFSTNTFPSWPLAHPFRYIAHNGEINTVQGNRNWMRAREALLAQRRGSPATSTGSSRSARPGASDSATFDEVLELLHLGGYALPHAVLMMIPEAWENHESMAPAEAGLLPVPRLAHGAVGRPGVDRLHRRHRHRRRARPQRPAPVALLGHRRRPRRSWRRRSACSTSTRPRSCRRAGSSRAACSWSTPPRAASSTTTRSRPRLAAAHPYEQWLDEQPGRPRRPARTGAHELRPHTRRSSSASRSSATPPRSSRSSSSPMARTGAEPLGSMGTDTPIAVLSTRPRLLFDYFPQLFAQVTNPPLDAIREELVTSLGGTHRARGQPARPRARVVPPDPPAAPDHRQRRAGQADPHRHATTAWTDFQRHRPAVPVPRSAEGGAGLRARARRAAPRRPAEAIERRRQHPRSSPTATPPTSWRRSRRCCSRRRCTTTSSARRPAPGSGSSSSAGDAREVHHMALLSGTARRHQPLPGLRDDRGPDRRGPDRGHRPGQGGAQLHQGLRQGRPQGDVEDGHLDGRVLHRGPDLRGHRPGPGARRRVLHRHRSAASAASASTSSPRRCAAAPRRWPTRTGPSERAHRELDGRRRVPVAPRGRVPPVQPRDGLQAAARHPHQALRDLQGVHRARSTTSAAQLATLRGLFRFRDRRAPAGADRRGRAGQRDRQALRHRRHVATARSRPRPTRRWPSP